MGDDDDRHLVSKRVEGLPDERFRANVERTGWLVENQNIRILHKRSSDDQPLLLPTAQVTSVFAHLPADTRP